MIFNLFNTLHINQRVWKIPIKIEANRNTFKEEIGEDILEFIDELFNDQDFILCNTSGTTGPSKAIALNKSFLIESANRTLNFLDIKEGNKALLCLPTKHIAGKMMIVRAIVCKLQLVSILPSAEISLHKFGNFNFVALTPHQAARSFNQLKIKPPVKLIIGGAPISTDLEKQLKSLDQTQVYETYGMTETASNIAMRDISSGAKRFAPLPGIKLNTNNQQELVIQIGQNIVATKDIVALSKEGFDWKGRSDFIINSGGIKLNPETIERKFSSFITEVFIITSVNDSVLGEKLVLALESKNNSTIHNFLCSVVEQASKFFDPFEVCKFAYCLETFPRTKSGKIIRKEVQKIINSDNSKLIKLM